MHDAGMGAIMARPMLAFPRDSWRTITALCGTLAVGVAIWVAGHLAFSAEVHEAGVVAHLVALAVGFGGVLTADFLMLRWLAGRSTLSAAVRGVSRLHLPIWAGVVGLIGSGCVLEPNLGAPLTMVKMALVVGLTVNGFGASALSRRLVKHADDTPLPARLLAWGAACGAISQVCWWGSIGIGFWNSAH
ncbi:hypothetical protein [Nocardia camponoti]|uniref:Uncharacterized protein n=1 Tax=Nocardia camponoti TaxID=1616106 RepID=A0A917QQV3_9NOCA|nr:hypothetical protein [Nocardia camponoti]GGK62634.1 hypothetical protein GCM10011591_38580 [Nocardia camponoti]